MSRLTAHVHMPADVVAATVAHRSRPSGPVSRLTEHVHMLADVVAVIGTQDIVFGEVDR